MVATIRARHTECPVEVLWIDASHFTNAPYVQRGWYRKGTQAKVPPCQAPKRHAVRGLASPAPALLLATGRAGDVQDVPGISPPTPPAVSRGAAPRAPRQCPDAPKSSGQTLSQAARVG